MKRKCTKKKLANRKRGASKKSIGSFTLCMLGGLSARLYTQDSGETNIYVGRNIILNKQTKGGD